MDDPEPEILHNSFLGLIQKQNTTQSRHKQKPAKSANLKQPSLKNAEEHLRLTIINMEGKGNASFINSLESTSDIIFNREHWRYEFLTSCKLLPEMDMLIVRRNLKF